MICPSQAPKLMRGPICEGGTGRLEGADWQKSISTQLSVRSERSRSEIKMQQSWDEINWPKCRSKDDPSRYLIIFIIVDHCHFSCAQSWILFPCSSITGFSCPEPESLTHFRFWNIWTNYWLKPDSFWKIWRFLILKHGYNKTCKIGGKGFLVCRAFCQIDFVKQLRKLNTVFLMTWLHPQLRPLPYWFNA